MSDGQVFGGHKANLNTSEESKNHPRQAQENESMAVTAISQLFLTA
jgi:hypothetical protein